MVIYRSDSANSLYAIFEHCTLRAFIRFVLSCHKRLKGRLATQLTYPGFSRQLKLCLAMLSIPCYVAVMLQLGCWIIIDVL